MFVSVIEGENLHRLSEVYLDFHPLRELFSITSRRQALSIPTIADDLFIGKESELDQVVRAWLDGLEIYSRALKIHWIITDCTLLVRHRSERQLNQISLSLEMFIEISSSFMTRRWLHAKHELVEVKKSSKKIDWDESMSFWFGEPWTSS